MENRIYVLGRSAYNPEIVDLWCLVQDEESMWVEYRWYRPTALTAPRLGKRRYGILEFFQMPGAEGPKEVLRGVLVRRGMLPERAAAAPVRPSAEVIPFPRAERADGRV
jgi:hypothetical protein